MKIVKIDSSRLKSVLAEKVTTKNGDYFAVSHGEEGRNRWRYVLPMAAREFPAATEETGLTLDEEYKLVDLHKEDRMGNPRYLISIGEEDGTWLVLLSMDPGFRGGVADFVLSGNVKMIAKGEEAQGIAGGMGGAPCPVLLVTGPCEISWTRTGRLYGGVASVVVKFDGTEWDTPRSADRCDDDDIALNY